LVFVHPNTQEIADPEIMELFVMEHDWNAIHIVLILLRIAIEAIWEVSRRGGCCQVDHVQSVLDHEQYSHIEVNFNQQLCPGSDSDEPVNENDVDDGIHVGLDHD
jgi:hypothetical protein